MTIKRKVDTKYKLPTLNWIALKPNQVRGTIFNELDEERPRRRINFAEFEEKFRLGGAVGAAPDPDSDTLASFPSKRFRKPDTVSLLEHTRLRNIAISRRKLDTPVEKVIAAVNSLDLKQLPLESVEILQRMVPTEAEQKAYKEYVAEKKPINQLTEEDKFLMQLTKVERISAKLSIMSYMGNFFDNIHLITPQIHAIISGSSSVKSSTKLRNVLEIILAFGNYLNSSKRGPAYGFKLQSLDTLMDTKSTDKRISLLHYIVATIRQNFPELMNFDTELLYIDKAAQVSLENVAGDVSELERGMEQVRREAEARDCLRAAPHVLRDFLANASDKLRRLRGETKHAQDSFASCVEYFGEAPRGCDANAFFSLLVRFTRAFKQADAENEQRRRLEQAAQHADHVDPNKAKLAQKKQQEAVINELKTKSQAVGEKKLLHQDEVYNGALEDILHGLRSEPYRRADAVRRSHRRRINSHRLSKGLEELDVWYELDSSDALESPVQNAVNSINARCNTDKKKRRKDLEMVHKKQSIAIYNIEDNVTEFPPSEPRKRSTYRVAPAPMDCEVEERCELIKSTYEVISKYTRAMFDKQNETVVWTMCLFYISRVLHSFT